MLIYANQLENDASIAIFFIVSQKTTFPVEFLDKNCTTDRERQTMIICGKKLKKVFRFKMAAITKPKQNFDIFTPERFYRQNGILPRSKYANLC